MKKEDSKIVEYDDLPEASRRFYDFVFTKSRNENDFARKIGLNRADSIYKITKYGSVPGDVTLQRVKAAFPDFDINSLYENEPEAIPYHQQRMQSKIDGDDNKAPLIPVKAQAGYTRAYDQTDFLNTMEKYALPPGITRHGSTWAYWEIEGDSMEPNFYNRDIILTSQVHPMDWNVDGMRNFYTYVVVTADSVYIKRVYLKDESTWVMISENEDNGYPQFTVNPKDVKDVWVFRRHISSRAPASKQFEIKI